MTSNRKIENTLLVMSYVTRAAEVLTDLYEEMQFCVMISGMWTSCGLKNNKKAVTLLFSWTLNIYDVKLFGSA